MTLDELRAHLDRPPPNDLRRSWRDWYAADGRYLGVSSGRTGPDVTTVATQPCACPTCLGKPRQAAVNASGPAETVVLGMDGGSPF